MTITATDIEYVWGFQIKGTHGNFHEGIKHEGGSLLSARRTCMLHVALSMQEVQHDTKSTLWKSTVFCLPHIEVVTKLKKQSIEPQFSPEEKHDTTTEMHGEYVSCFPRVDRMNCRESSRQVPAALTPGVTRPLYELCIGGFPVWIIFELTNSSSV